MNCFDYTEIEEFEKNWSLGEYDNSEKGCVNCGRHRVCKCPNGKHRCEKCNWCPEDSKYIAEPSV